MLQDIVPLMQLLKFSINASSIHSILDNDLCMVNTTNLLGTGAARLFQMSCLNIAVY